MRSLVRTILVIGLLVLTVAPASATLPGGDGDILYLRFNPDTGGVVRSIAPDGSGDRAIAEPEMTSDASWAPDGALAAFAWYDPFGEGGGIAVVDPDTGDRTDVLAIDDLPGRPWWIVDVTFAPSGDALAFEALYPRSGRRIFTVGTDGADLAQISGDLDIGNPDWSSTDRIVATTDIGDDDRVSIYTMDPDGSNVDRVVRLPAPRTWRVQTGVTPSWSPDGSSIVFEAQAGRLRSDVWMIDADGTDLRRLTDTPRRWERAPQFSPSGTEVAYARGGRDVRTSVDLWIAGVTGGRDRLTETPRVSEYPLSWQPL